MDLGYCCEELGIGYYEVYQDEVCVERGESWLVADK